MNRKIILVLTVFPVLLVLYIVLFGNFYNQTSTNKELKNENINKSNHIAKSEEVEKNKNPKALMELAKLIKNSKVYIDRLPDGLEEVVVTDALKKTLDEWPSGSGYAKLDYRLRLFSRLKDCLGKDEPSSGEMIIHFLFDIDPTTGIAMASDGTNSSFEGDENNAFKVRETDLSKDDQDRVVECARIAHMGLTMDISDSLAKEPILRDAAEFYNPLVLHFPLKDSKEYIWIAYDGRPPDPINNLW